jgi:membrane peptidoglycan carboxypeptidase
MGGLLSLAFSFIVIGVVAGGLGFGYLWLSLDQKGLLKIPEREPGLMVTAADGTILAERGAFYGDDVRVDELPDYVPNAIIAIEDRRFRQHFAGAGRLDAYPATRQKPVPDAGAHAAAQAPGGSAGGLARDQIL